MRQKQSHKGTYGHLLLIAGNAQYGGAGILAASAAVYAGGGLVTLATAKNNFTAVRATLAEIMLIDFTDFDQLSQSLANATGVVIGPGLGTDSTSLAVFNFTLAHIAEGVPLIIDGSAIDLVAQHDLQVSQSSRGRSIKRHRRFKALPHRNLRTRRAGCPNNGWQPRDGNWGLGRFLNRYFTCLNCSS